MSGLYALVLRSCEPAGVNTVSKLLMTALSVNDKTIEKIMGACPIILIDALEEKEAAALSLSLRSLEFAGAAIDYIKQGSEDLPKIDWPKQPSIFKQSIPAIIRTYEIKLNAGGQEYSLLDLLIERISGTAAEGYAPAATTGTQQNVSNPGSSKLTSVKEFTGANLPEVTPFSNVALTDNTPSTSPVSASTGGSDDVATRMNELFGMDDDDELVPSSNEITNILDKILPDEEPGSGNIQQALAPAPTPVQQPGIGVSTNGSETSGVNQVLPSGTGNFSLFLSKIPDAARRDKAVPLIAELAQIAKEEAEKLAKKVIIPVLRSVTQDEAEEAKHKFAEIGILARIKSS